MTAFQAAAPATTYPIGTVPDAAALWSIKQTASYIGLGLTATRELIEAGEFTTIRVGRRRLVLAESVGSFVERKLHEGSSK
jgi:excisionase family DNA binding protein